MAVNIGNLVAGESEIELSYISIPALKGDKGDAGRGISSVIKTSTVGLVDTWTITYTDGSTSSFDVTNGADGDDYVITEADYEEIADIVLDNIEIPTKVSDLDNDEGFIDNTVNDLQNYYKKSETYTKQEVDGKVSSVYKYKGSVATYQDLPSTSLTIGDVYNVESTGDNYAWTGTVWDKLGGDIDLSNYYNKTQTDTLLNGKQDTLESGTNIKTINNQSILGNGNITIQGGGGTSDYTDLTNKPSINNVTLSGNKTTSDLGLGTYSKPSGGIPKTDLASDVQTSLGKADTAIQEHQDISGKQDITDNSLTTINKTITSAINEVDSIAKGANQALSYGNYSTMITAFNSLANNVYNVGQNVMIITLQVPDLWISGIESTSQTYTYTTDEAFTTALNTNGYVQVGYYKLSALETQKVDLTDYVKNTDYATAEKGGTIRTSNASGLGISNGNLYAVTKEYNTYNSASNNMFIGKGTLENVITGKNLETSNNKVTSISSSSTNTEYPGAKAVYDYIQSLNGDEVNY